jgi:polysaccharide chain length determinant protein (PEP-CTERM system associated)
MIRNGEISLADLKRVLKQRWWVPPLATVGCLTLALMLSAVLPKRYTSETIVLVDQPKVPSDYVKPVITEDLNHRLASMQEQILSRTRLEPIIEKFGLYSRERGRVHPEDFVERLKKSVTVTPVAPMAGTQDRTIPGFFVSVTFDNPQLAQQICSEITSMFMEQNARARGQQAARTTSFLNQQLDGAKAKLDAQDAKLAQFKRQYLGSLPEEEQANLSLLMGMNTQLEANTQTLSRAHQDKTFNESLLSQQETNWKAAQTGHNPETLEVQLSALQDQLTALQARYTAQHPDVIKLQNSIDELKKRIATAPKMTSPTEQDRQAVAIEPPQIQQLRARLHQDDLNIADLTKRQAQIQDQIHVLQGRVQASPAVEQQFKELTRSYQSALDFYNDLLKKHDQSAMATDLENQQESEQFRVLDPPSLPSQPSFPNKLNFAGGGLGAGLALGLGIVYLLAISDKSLYTERDVELALKLPVLALIPVLEGASGSGMRSSRLEKLSRVAATKV